MAGLLKSRVVLQAVNNAYDMGLQQGLKAEVTTPCDPKRKEPALQRILLYSASRGDLGDGPD